MFLKNLRDDTGSAMAAVIGVMALTMIISTTVVASTMNGLAVTTSARASVQSRAAAEAGIAKALVDMESSCVATYSATTDPLFDYALEYQTSTSGWVAGCPPMEAVYVKILSTGYADVRGVGASAGDDTVLEAIYAYHPVMVPVPRFEPAVYAHQMDGALKNLELTAADEGIDANIQIKNGNVICSNGANIGGSIMLSNGYASLDNCNVYGSIHVSKHVSISGLNTTVTGDVLAVGDGVVSGGYAISVKSGSKVIANPDPESDTTGSLFAGHNIYINSIVDGSATIAAANGNKADLGSSARLGTDLISSGNANLTSGAVVGGTVSTNVTGLATVPYPRVPEWTDIDYPSTRGSWDDYYYVNWSGSCIVGNDHPFWTSLANTTATQGNVIVNAFTVCGTSGLKFQNNSTNLYLSGNIAFIAQNFYVDKIELYSNEPGVSRDAWFIVPDNVLDDRPTPEQYSSNCDVYLTSEFDFRPEIAALVYTPCKITSNRNNWRGQFYSGSMEFLQQATMTYVEVGVPGVDFYEGLPPEEVLTDAVLGGRVSYKEIG